MAAGSLPPRNPTGEVRRALNPSERVFATQRDVYERLRARYKARHAIPCWTSCRLCRRLLPRLQGGPRALRADPSLDRGRATEPAGGEGAGGGRARARAGSPGVGGGDRVDECSWRYVIQLPGASESASLAY